MVSHNSICHPNLFTDPHLLFKQLPLLAVVLNQFVRLNCPLIVTELNHDVSLSFQNAIENQFLVDDCSLVTKVLFNECFKHQLYWLNAFVHQYFLNFFELQPTVIDFEILFTISFIDSSILLLIDVFAWIWGNHCVQFFPDFFIALAQFLLFSN